MLIRIEKYKDLRVSDNVDLTIGKTCGFNGMVIHNDGAEKGTPRAAVRIGCNLHSGKKCMIRTSDHDFSRGYPLIHGALAGYKAADVTIGDHVWLGDEVLIMKGVTIGDGAIIQARSVVVSDIPPLAIAGGHPCRPFARRDAEEYEFFKSLALSRVKPEDQAEAKQLFNTRLEEFRKRRSTSLGAQT